MHTTGLGESHWRRCRDSKAKKSFIPILLLPQVILIEAVMKQYLMGLLFTHMQHSSGSTAWRMPMCRLYIGIFSCSFLVWFTGLWHRCWWLIISLAIVEVAACWTVLGHMVEYQLQIERRQIELAGHAWWFLPVCGHGESNELSCPNLWFLQFYYDLLLMCYYSERSSLSFSLFVCIKLKIVC